MALKLEGEVKKQWKFFDLPVVQVMENFNYNLVKYLKSYSAVLFFLLKTTCANAAKYVTKKPQ